MVCNFILMYLFRKRSFAAKYKNRKVIYTEIEFYVKPILTLILISDIYSGEVHEMHDAIYVCIEYRKAGVTMQISKSETLISVL